MSEEVLGQYLRNRIPCLFQIDIEENTTLIVIYVDDILFAIRHQGTFTKLRKKLVKEFEIKYFGNIGYCFRIEFPHRDEIASIHQRGYNNELQRFGTTYCEPVSTPMKKSLKLNT